MNTMTSSGMVNASPAELEENLKQCVDLAQKTQFILQTMCTGHSLKTFDYSLLQSMAVVLRDTANELYERASVVKDQYGVI